MADVALWLASYMSISSQNVICTKTKKGPELQANHNKPNNTQTSKTTRKSPSQICVSSERKTANQTHKKGQEPKQKHSGHSGLTTASHSKTCQNELSTTTFSEENTRAAWQLFFTARTWAKPHRSDSSVTLLLRRVVQSKFFCGRRLLPFGGSHLRLPSGPAGIWTTTGSLSALAIRRPDGSVGMALVLPALTDCRWWFESLLVHSGVSSATRRKATGADHKKSLSALARPTPYQLSHRVAWVVQSKTQSHSNVLKLLKLLQKSSQKHGQKKYIEL